MEKETHYQLLQVDKKASSELIKLAYERLIMDAKSKLADSPLFHDKENKLTKAYKTLIKPELRQLYNEQLIQDQLIAKKFQQSKTLSPKIKQRRSISDKTSFSLSKLIFSKLFLGLLVLITALIFILPSGKERVMNEAVKNQYELQKKQIEFEEQRYLQQVLSQESYREENSERRKKQLEASEKRRQEYQRKQELSQFEREQQRIHNQEARLIRIEEKQRKKAEYKEKREQQALQRKRDKEKRELERSRSKQEYAAKQRMNKMISEQKREAYTKSRKEDVISVDLGY